MCVLCCTLKHSFDYFEVHQIHQIDLVDMRNQQVEYHGRTYRYVLSLLDVFLRFHWLAPLTTKHAHGVKVELEEIYDLHGTPDMLQSDQGKEFYGSVKHYCERKKIKVIKTRPYHPQSQGKVERSHRSPRQKIAFDLITHEHVGVNWVKNLLKYAKCLKNEKREELGWWSAFEVYYGRKCNELVKCGIPRGKQGDPEVQPVLPPSIARIQNSLNRIPSSEETLIEKTK